MSTTSSTELPATSWSASGVTLLVRSAVRNVEPQRLSASTMAGRSSPCSPARIRVASNSSPRAAASASNSPQNSTGPTSRLSNRAQALESGFVELMRRTVSGGRPTSAS